MMKIMLINLSRAAIILTALISINSMACDKNHPELKTVSYVDLNKYIGTWHQIAYLPNSFQKKCTIDTTATYTIRPDGKIGVRNECTKNSNGERKTIEGKARVVDTLTNAKLSVKFFWFQPGGDYWIIDLADDYSYAVVGAPNRKYLWILSRTPQMDATLYEQILVRAKNKGFDTTKVVITSQVL